jgi:hypothetical protein
VDPKQENAMRHFQPPKFLALCMASAMFVVCIPAFADSSHDPTITEAHADGGLLHIIGLNLGGGKPKVTLGTLPLSVVSMTATQIDALVPATVAPGSYLLAVSLTKGKGGGDDRNDDGKYDEFWVTIGAAGPLGATGAQGPAGRDGSIGPAGPSGVQGPAGAQGPVGTQGPAGAQGATGIQGPSGPVGRDGTAGPSGPMGPVGATGPVGPAGSAGVPTSFIVHAARTFVRGEPSQVEAYAECPPGSAVTSGFGGGPNYESVLVGVSGNGWLVTGTATIFADPYGFLYVNAICLRIS